MIGLVPSHIYVLHDLFVIGFKRKTSDKTKKQRNGQSHLVKSLFEDEQNNDKRFSENIEVREGYFFCRKCDFTATKKCQARTHSSTCGSKRKRGLSVKVHKCLDCDKTFNSKALLISHNKEHGVIGYKCSICMKTIFRRQSYQRHVKSHQEPPKKQCDVCDKIFRYNYDLKRHKTTHFKTASLLKNGEFQRKEASLVEKQIDVYESCILYSFWQFVC